MIRKRDTTAERLSFRLFSSIPTSQMGVVEFWRTFRMSRRSFLELRDRNGERSLDGSLGHGTDRGGTLGECRIVSRDVAFGVA